MTGPKNRLPDHLPEAILGHRIEHSRILADGGSAMNGDPRMRSPALIEHGR